MNYVQELTAFYDWLELNALSPSAINLWYALMHINHKTGWSETFTVAESVLCIKTSLTDRTLRKVRNELKQKGRINFTSRKGKAPIYQIIPFQPQYHNPDPFPEGGKDPFFTGRTENNSAICTEARTVHSSANRTEVGSALFRQQTDKQTNRNWSDLLEVWRSVFGFDLKANHAQIIGTFMEDDKMTEPLILEAIERVKRATKPVLNYLWTILANWAKLGIKTIKDLIAHEKERLKARVPIHTQTYRGRDIPEEAEMDFSAGEDWL